MSSALVGYTGFVGSNLRAQTSFDALYNSSNIESIDGRSFELLVCAGAPAEKWKANQDPEQDRRTIERLMACLRRVAADAVILISTVDVYPLPIEVDEGTPVPDDGGSPYGRHRFLLERFMTDRFECSTVRLPGLFGPYLKKNVIYDLLHDHRIGAIVPESEYQFYGLETLWEDLGKMRRLGIPLMNFATEPVRVQEIAHEVFGRDLPGSGASSPARYDVRTRYDQPFGGRNGYIQSRPEVLAALRRFVHPLRDTAATR